MCVEIWKKLSILWYPKFQLVIVKYHEVEALFCKVSCRFEKLMSLYTQNANTRSVLGTDPVLEIGPILQHLNSRNFLIPNLIIDPSF